MTREEKQKAIDALKISAPVMAMTQEEFNDYIQIINQIMDWLEQEPKTGWIPVSERLPKTNGQYLVTKAIGDYTYIGCMDYSTNLAKTDKFDFHGKNYAGWYEYDMEYGFLETDGVIAWMPLPEAYMESEG